ncbi:flavodoxin family protein [Salinactinospora qingdaonensis]|uniref:Flavodoxin family protein n=1 Tax=Salinactinospora qingdaonensis TaxID=702744 RepID=A0ABP7FU88_9ACTN
MNILIVVESYFGNTLTVAQAVAAGLSEVLGADSVTTVSPSEAPREIPAGVGLLLVGAPTHDFAMPKEQTRRQAVEKGGTHGDGVGVREWIENLPPRPELLVRTFDTSFEKMLSGSAAKSAYKLLRKRGFGGAERGESFHVAGRGGPLNEGEQRRAQEWGRQLAGTMTSTTRPGEQ